MSSGSQNSHRAARRERTRPCLPLLVQAADHCRRGVVRGHGRGGAGRPARAAEDDEKRVEQARDVGRGDRRGPQRVCKWRGQEVEDGPLERGQVVRMLVLIHGRAEVLERSWQTISTAITHGKGRDIHSSSGFSAGRSLARGSWPTTRANAARRSSGGISVRIAAHTASGTAPARQSELSPCSPSSGSPRARSARTSRARVSVHASAGAGSTKSASGASAGQLWCRSGASHGSRDAGES
jgi:hypothetical protein